MTKDHRLILSSMPLFLVVFIDGAGLGLVFPILNAIIIDPHVSILPAAYSSFERNILYGVSVGIFMLCWFFGAALISDLSDAIGRKRALFICLTGSCLGYLLSAIAIDVHSMALLILGRIVAGFTAGSQPVAQASIIDIAPKEKKTAFIAYVLLFTQLGFIVGPIIGGILSNSKLVSWFNFSVPMLAAMALSLVNLLMLVAFYQESYVVRKKIKIKVSRALTLFIDAFNHRRVRHLSLVFFIYILAWANYYTFIPMFVMYRYQFTPTDTSFVMCLMSLGFAFGIGYLTGKVSAIWSRRQVIIYCLLGASILNGVVLLIYSPVLMWSLIFPTATLVSVAYACIISLYSDQAGANQQGWVMGVSGSIFGLGYAVSDFASAFMVNISYIMPIVLCAIGLLMASLLMTRPFYHEKD